MDRIELRADFSHIRYANCWEDPLLLIDALQPAPGKRLLSIASAGDNSFSLLAHGAEVVAVDLSPAQLACVELRREAIRQLAQPACLAFLGITPADDRQSIYADLRAGLSPEAARFWDGRQDAIREGFIHAGKFEHYFHLFRRRVVPLIHPRRRIRELLAEKPADARESFYDRRWNNWRWRLTFRLFFSRTLMGRLGRDPEFFKYVDGPVSEAILRRTRYALTALDTHDNPYLRYILTGNFENALPHYLLPEVYPLVKANLDKLTIRLMPVQEAAATDPRPFDGFNLSDIFEYLDEATSASVYQTLVDHAAPGARLAYWNMLVPRQCPTACQPRINALTELAAQLFARDRAWFYSRFRVEEVR